jgi:hypothetical protein
VGAVCFHGAGALLTERDGAVVLRAADTAHPAGAGLLAAVRHGEGRVVVAADSDLFGDDAFGEFDHRRLWLNLFFWVALPAFCAAPRTIESAAARDVAWVRLRDETDALRALQEPRGEVDLTRHDAAEVRARVAAMIDAVSALEPYFPHHQAYLAQVAGDLRRWLDDGCGKPDFAASLAVFRPERDRRDGIEHLVVFPLYTPNGSPDTRFEALIVRTPWPEFVARLEGERYDNAKFVPVQLVDHTAGYDGECAVLFPETVSLVGRPTNNFGGIFCDREAARFQRSTTRAAEVLGIDLPPDAAALLANGDLVRETYILWDMIHDRWHSHGDLPFDPFMIRQRLPYWMYSLEELRVDLATYGTAGELVREGFAFARYVQYAILFDRILRFPVTGDRVRNYDGLGGQLLFAYLHRAGVVRWTDNRLLIDWQRVEDEVAGLRERLEDLYRRGIDLSKVSYWIDAHDLIAEFVRPNVGSQWRREGRVFSDEAERLDRPRARRRVPAEHVLRDAQEAARRGARARRGLLKRPLGGRSVLDPVAGEDRRGRPDHRPDRAELLVGQGDAVLDDLGIEVAEQHELDVDTGEHARVLVAPLAFRYDLEAAHRLAALGQQHGHRVADAAGQADQQQLERRQAGDGLAGLERIVHRDGVLAVAGGYLHAALVVGLDHELGRHATLLALRGPGAHSRRSRAVETSR